MAFQDIANLFSSAGAPAVATASTFAVFEFAERVTSPAARAALTHRIKSFDVRSVAALPAGTSELFDRLFGPNHFTTNCLLRSFAFSMSALILATSVWALSNLKDAVDLFQDMARDELSLVLFVSWIPISAAPDYLNLYKTRLIIEYLRKAKNLRTWVLASILFGDLFFGLAIFMFLNAVYYRSFLEIYRAADLLNLLSYGLENIIKGARDTLGLNYYYSATFYAGMTPSFWLWLFVFSVFLTRVLIRSEHLISWLRWLLDIEKAPFRSVGIVACTLVFVTTTCISAIM